MSASYELSFDRDVLCVTSNAEVIREAVQVATLEPETSGGFRPVVSALHRNALTFGQRSLFRLDR